MIGILNINKAKGLSSGETVYAVRKILSVKAVGHFGTLDPMAEGVLLMGVGKATRLFDYLLSKDKEYIADFRFGEQTDTLDAEGKVTESGGRIPSIDEVRAALPKLLGKSEQTPPLFSAKNVGGKRAYELARSGLQFELKPNPIEIYELLAESVDFSVVRLKVRCSSGTYIRSIGRDLARLLCTFATMTMLRRTKCGAFDISNAVTLDTLREKGASALLPAEAAFAGAEKVTLDEEYYSRLICGDMPRLERLYPTPFALYCGGELFGLARTDISGKIKIISYLRG